VSKGVSRTEGFVVTVTGVFGIDIGGGSGLSHHKDAVTEKILLGLTCLLSLYPKEWITKSMMASLYVFLEILGYDATK